MPIGRKLVKVERLGWYRAGELGDPRVGPVHLLFEGGIGILLDVRSDWSLRFVETAPGDDGWLDPYDYDWYESRWVLRDASGESPFATTIAKPLLKLEPLRDEADEVIGLNLNFGGQTLTLKMREGEVTT